MLSDQIDKTQDFHALSSREVEILLEEAKQVRYRQPKNANGSRARYYFAYLQRQQRRAKKCA